MSDLQNGQQFYEQQQEGFGAYFLDSLFSDIDALLLYAGIHQQFFGYYHALSKRFLYTIYYHVRSKTIQVWRGSKVNCAQCSWIATSNRVRSSDLHCVCTATAIDNITGVDRSTRSRIVNKRSVVGVVVGCTGGVVDTGSERTCEATPESE